jgi:nucleoside-diphosphate-sugar epimerase
MSELSVLYIGGTGEISYECLVASAHAGHRCFVFNRGVDPQPLPQGVTRIVGDLGKPGDLQRLAQRRFDVVCQFKAYLPGEVQRDIDLFKGNCGQYVFISTASAYQKPNLNLPITEKTPLLNPYWNYSHQKILCEELIGARNDFPSTVVRPSLTYSRRFPGTFIGGDEIVWRMLKGKPIVLHSDGQAMWTITHSRDFAALFTPLLGNSKALGETYQVMTETAFSWNHIYSVVAEIAGVKPRFVYVPMSTIVKAKEEWVGPLVGDKGWTTLFDTRKIQAISGKVERLVTIEEGFRSAWPHVRGRVEAMKPDLALHALIDQLAARQEAI